MHSVELQKLGLKSGDAVKVHQGKASTRMKVGADDSVPFAAARVAAGHPDTASLGAMFGFIRVERITEDRA